MKVGNSSPVRKKSKKRLSLLMGASTTEREVPKLTIEQLIEIKRNDKKKERLKKRLKRKEKKRKTMIEKRRKKYWFDTPLVVCAYHFIKSKCFRKSIIITIGIYTFSLMLPYYGMSNEYRNALELINVIFNYGFIAELLLKLLGLGVVKYVRDPANLIDAVVVVCSIFEMLIFMQEPNVADAKVIDRPGTAFTVFRILRILRVFRLFEIAGNWNGMQKFLDTIISAMADVIHSSVLLLIFLFFMTGLGNALFGGTMQWYYYDVSISTMTPRAHFDDFGWGFVTTFQILCGGENWNEVLFDTMYAASQKEQTVNHPVLPVLYFCTLIIVGQFMILNLFLAILLANFVPSEFGEHHHEHEEELVTNDFAAAEKEQDVDEDLFENKSSNENNENVSSKSKATDNGTSDSSTAASLPESSTMKSSHYYYNDQIVSCGCCSSKNKCRKNMYTIITHKYFEIVLLGVVLLSCISLILDEPGTKQLCDYAGNECVRVVGSYYVDLNTKSVFIFAVNVFVNLCFTIEMIIKIVALGFVKHKGAYLKSWWNIFDGTLVVIGVTCTLVSTNAFWDASLVLRSLRALKALRMVENYSGVRHVANTILLSLPRMLDVVMLLLFFFILFGIIGMRLWMGALKHCNDPSITLKSECVGHFNLTMHQCEWMPSQFATVKCLLNQNKEIDRLFPKVWKNISPWNFDDILNSVLTVFVATSGETWPNMMYDVMNAAGEDQPMHEMHSCWPNNGHWNQVYQSRLLPPLYFIFLTLLCRFLFLNVIVGVIIDEYAKQKESDMENMSKEKRTEWLEHKILSAMHPIQLMNRPHGRCWRRRDQFYDIVTFPSFEKFYDCCIVVNLIVIMFKTANESDTKLNVMMYCDVFFCILFSIECIMKFVAYGMVQYFESNENKIDFFALLSTIIYLFLFFIQDLQSDMKLKYTNYGVSVSAQNLFGGMVVFRINRLVKWSSKVQLLVNTFVYAVPSMLYVMIMWFIMYFTFAVLGMNLFAGIKHGDYLNDDANFDTWLNAGKLLCQFVCNYFFVLVLLLVLFLVLLVIFL